jgi:hypothetical protein
MKSFEKFINESKYDSFSSIIAKEILSLAKTSNSKESHHELSYEEPVSIDISVTIVKTLEFSAKNNKYFSRLPWEDINFKNRGFVIDANTYVPTADDEFPEMEMVIVINTDSEPNCYQSLYFKVLETVRHEIEHALQAGFNKVPSRQVKTRQRTREKAEDSYQYFLLPNELSPMVSGMYLSAKKKRIPIDFEFVDYLKPFLDSQFMTSSEFEKVMKAWLTHAVKNFPGVIISDQYRNLVKPV